MRPVLCTNKVHECSHAALNPVASLADQGNETENEDSKTILSPGLSVLTGLRNNTACITVTHI